MIKMNTYCVRLTLRSPSGSAWQADTIFGHLCWLCTWRYGAEVVEDWKKRFLKGEPPFVVSDGFPGDLLPRPHGLPHLPSPQEKREGLKYAERQKDIKKIAWLTPQEFHALRSGNTFSLLEWEQRKTPHPHVTFKNQINRLTGTTGDEGQLYPFEEIPWQSITIYLRVAAGEEILMKQLFNNLQETGYGKRKSIGYGQIASYTWKSFEFPPVDNPNGFVSLSHFVPAQTDPTKGQWKLNVKYGKLGGERAVAGNPFKRPVVMLTPGSWFRTENAPKAWYGRLVNGVSAEFADVVQYGLAFAVPINVKEKQDA